MKIVFNSDSEVVSLVKEGLKRGFDEFILVGVLGMRFDHSFGNISILLFLDQQNKTAQIIDDYSVIEIVKDTPKYIEDEFSFFSSCGCCLLCNANGNNVACTVWICFTCCGSMVSSYCIYCFEYYFIKICKDLKDDFCIYKITQRL